MTNLLGHGYLIEWTQAIVSTATCGLHSWQLIDAMIDWRAVQPRRHGRRRGDPKPDGVRVEAFQITENLQIHTWGTVRLAYSLVITSLILSLLGWISVLMPPPPAVQVPTDMQAAIWLQVFGLRSGLLLISFLGCAVAIFARVDRQHLLRNAREAEAIAALSAEEAAAGEAGS